jgi:hypothetical protein
MKEINYHEIKALPDAEAIFEAIRTKYVIPAEYPNQSEKLIVTANGNQYLVNAVLALNVCGDTGSSKHDAAWVLIWEDARRINAIISEQNKVRGFPNRAWHPVRE